jgi:hypothetical protein
LYNNFKISNPIKTPAILLRLSILLLLSLTPIFSYSADVIADATTTVPANKAAQQVEAVPAEAPLSDKTSANTDEFCVIEAFSYVVNWVENAIKRIDNEHFSSKQNDAIEEEPKVVLDLTIPDIKYGGTMGVDKGQKLNFPDLFSTQAKKPYSKEAPSSSFGGRLLMDDAELESMEEYRLNDVREAVRGAEVSLEFKTN